MYFGVNEEMKHIRRCINRLFRRFFSGLFSLIDPFLNVLATGLHHINLARRRNVIR